MFAANDNDFGKVVIGLIFAVIWAVSAAASAYSKKKQAEKQRQIREQAEASARSAPNWGEIATEQGARVPPIVVPQPSQRTGGMATVPPSRAPQTAKMPTLRQKKFPAKKPKQRKPRETVQAPAYTSDVVTAVPVSVADAYTHTHREAAARAEALAGPTVDAAALRLWLTPDTLKRQFVLTEILQKPLTLRSTSERD